MGGSPTQQLPTPLTPEQKAQEQATYADLDKRGMSYDIDDEIIGAGKDLAKMAKMGLEKNIINPAVAKFNKMVERQWPAPRSVAEQERDADIGKSISASHAGTLRQSTEGEFKGTSQTQAPKKSSINTSAEEAMAMGLH